MKKDGTPWWVWVAVFLAVAGWLGREKREAERAGAGSPESASRAVQAFYREVDRKVDQDIGRVQKLQGTDVTIRHKSE